MVWYHLFYDIRGEELQRAQCFKEEHLLKKQDRLNRNQIVRSAIVIIILSLFQNSLKLHHWSGLFTYLTNWSQWCILLTASLGLLLASKPHYCHKSAINLYALHHIFYTLALFTQPVVVLIYWAIVHESNIKEMREEAAGDVKKFESMLIHSVLAHILPGLCCLALLLCTPCVLLKRHCRYLVAFGIFYGVSNYAATKSRGAPLYWFLTW